jgi:hypothetical protein
MTRKLRDAFPSGLHRDAFQLDNMHAVGFELKSRRVCAGQLLLWRRNSAIATRFPAEYQSRCHYICDRVSDPHDVPFLVIQHFRTYTDEDGGVRTSNIESAVTTCTCDLHKSALQRHQMFRTKCSRTTPHTNHSLEPDDVIRSVPLSSSASIMLSISRLEKTQTPVPFGILTCAIRTSPRPGILLSRRRCASRVAWFSLS